MANTERYTIETLAAGQPRPYADTVRHVRVSFESNGFQGDGEIEPSFMSEAAARMRLNGMLCGFTEKTAKDCEWFQTRLDWLRPVDGKPASEVIPHGDPKQIVASKWEFHTTTPFTD